MTTMLVKYDAAVRALAEAHRVDEAKDIRDKAVAVQAYARQANDHTLIVQATDIKLRAERRVGELLREMRERGERMSSKDTLARGSSVQPRELPTLEDLGVSKTQSSRWQEFAAMPAETFEREVVARGEAEILRKAKEIRAAQMEQSYAERVERLAKVEWGSDLPERRFPILLADPPWRFEVYNKVTGSKRCAEDHYHTMTTEAICALPVSELATDDAALFLWATSPHLPEALRVIEAWGFVYKTCLVWVKDASGMGYWVRNQHELLLIAARGDIPAPPPTKRPSSVIEAPRREHSRKPDEQYEIIEAMYPTLPKIELFARHARKGWATWGNEVQEAAE